MGFEGPGRHYDYQAQLGYAWAPISGQKALQKRPPLRTLLSPLMKLLSFPTLLWCLSPFYCAPTPAPLHLVPCYHLPCLGKHTFVQIRLVCPLHTHLFSHDCLVAFASLFRYCGVLSCSNAFLPCTCLTQLTSNDSKGHLSKFFLPTVMEVIVKS